MGDAVLTYGDAVLTYGDAVLTYGDAVLTYGDAVLTYGDALVTGGQPYDRLPKWTDIDTAPERTDIDNDRPSERRTNHKIDLLNVGRPSDESPFRNSQNEMFYGKIIWSILTRSISRPTQNFIRNTYL